MPQLHPKTRAMGPTKDDVSYDTFYDVKVLKIRMVVLKRKAKNVFLRTVALPMSDVFEPWSLGVNAYIQALPENAPLVDLHNNTVNKILHKHGFYDIVKQMTREDLIRNPLRHIRYNHLVDYYGFDPWQAPLFFGHKLETAMSGSGGPADAYASLAWRRYFPALLKPLPKVESK